MCAPLFATTQSQDPQYLDLWHFLLHFVARRHDPPFALHFLRVSSSKKNMPMNVPKESHPHLPRTDIFLTQVKYLTSPSAFLSCYRWRNIFVRLDEKKGQR